MTDEEFVRWYCTKRKLTRPKTNWKDLARLILSMVVCYLIVSSTILFLFANHGLGGFIIVTQSLLYIFVIILLLFLKPILVTSVLLYQHYASEQLRKSCVCMPTCSEYALICLRKYNTIKAIILIYRRLTKGCKGSYHVDFPP